MVVGDFNRTEEGKMSDKQKLKPFHETVMDAIHHHNSEMPSVKSIAITEALCKLMMETEIPADKIPEVLEGIRRETEHSGPMDLMRLRFNLEARLEADQERKIPVVSDEALNGQGV